jgi:hypothetical protein
MVDIAKVESAVIQEHDVRTSSRRAIKQAKKFDGGRHGLEFWLAICGRQAVINEEASVLRPFLGQRWR